MDNIIKVGDIIIDGNKLLYDVSEIDEKTKITGKPVIKVTPSNTGDITFKYDIHSKSVDYINPSNVSIYKKQLYRKINTDGSFTVNGINFGGKRKSKKSKRKNRRKSIKRK